ncbi:MAG: DUF2071 domain-containing protein [Phycisphaerales bacterium]
MKLIEPREGPPCKSLATIARGRFQRIEGRPLFYSDWDRALFMHFEVDRDMLQRHIPFELELHHGRAVVSLVAFTMRGLRFPIGGRLGALLTAPGATHGLLNVRTYIRHNGEVGIYFMREWIPNRLSVFIGPRTYGLPYRYGKVAFQHDHEHGTLRGTVIPGGNSGRLVYEAQVDPEASYEPCADATLSEFLLERYTAFTMFRDRARLFRIWHEPWLQTSLHVKIIDDSMLAASEPWHSASRLITANYSPGVRRVWIGRPRAVLLGAKSPGRDRG